MGVWKQPGPEARRALEHDGLVSRGTGYAINLSIEAGNACRVVRMRMEGPLTMHGGDEIPHVFFVNTGCSLWPYL